MTCEFLVLGSTGMLGQALLKEIKQRNNTVVGVARKKADICMDITNDKQLLEVIEEINPKIIINTVAIVDLSYCEENPSQCYLCNSRVSLILSKYCALNKKKYVYISTDHYFTGDQDRKHSEAHPVNLCNEYAMTKYIGERLSLVNDNALVVRTNIVGFRHDEKSLSFLEWAIKALENKEHMNLFDDFYTSSIDVRSFSKALCDLIDKDVNGIINLASSEVSNKKTFIETLAKQLGLSLANTNGCPMSQNTGIVKRNESLGLDVLKAEEILGYSLPTLLEVVNNLVREYRNGE
ncbi:MAG: sugar nucleotide-binding protein [Desulfobacter postgatei]|uniref:SDR family oxidoreductase n=1 Tax=Desulfobacter postgatei TaxID=2293 RepID=UPI0023F4A6DE|nr:sugar nucleotide-binding protein [Desulfobacter postgatei]MDD4273745.1 sugar nucleotide-binding protein [Desulfobacter postgatei]